MEHKLKRTKKELVKAHIERADESLALAKLIIKKELFNSTTIRELHVACFHLMVASLVDLNIPITKPQNVERLFRLHFVKSNKVDEHWVTLFNKLSDWRQQDDFGGFVTVEGERAKQLFNQVEQFKSIVLQQLQTF